MTKTAPTKLAKEYAAGVRADLARSKAASAHASTSEDAGRTLVILFTNKGASYRMMVAKVHVHPGERDRIEVAGKDMLGGDTWAPLPDGSNLIPSPEWVIRRAFWKLFSEGLNLAVLDSKLGTVDIGELNR